MRGSWWILVPWLWVSYLNTLSVCLLTFVHIFLYMLNRLVGLEQRGSLKGVLKLSSAQQAAILGSPFLKIGCSALSENRASVRCLVFGT